jgi:hypothetical protein
MEKYEMIGDFVNAVVPGHLITRFLEQIKKIEGKTSLLVFYKISTLQTCLKEAEERWKVEV